MNQRKPCVARGWAATNGKALGEGIALYPNQLKQLREEVGHDHDALGPLQRNDEEMMSLRQAMGRLFEDSFVRRPHWWPALAEGALPLSLEMYQTANDVVVKTAAPGAKPEEVDISITGDTLTIKGERKEEKEVKEADYFLKEHVYGSYSRTVTIPVPVQADKAEAAFENGILTLTLPKKEEAKPKQVKIKPKTTIEGAKGAKGVKKTKS